MACYHELRDLLENEGYYSYRLGISGMPMRGVDPSYSDLLKSIKSVMDVNNILSPGRYESAPGASS
jgi:4-cresol dehydrogenase (hydroxylating) flavoprotein subunit